MDVAGMSGVLRFANVAKLIDYAEQFGDVRATWEREFASGRLSALELDELAVGLRGVERSFRADDRGYRIEVEPQFRLRPRERRELAARLIAAGHERRAARLFSRSTWWRIRRDYEQAHNGGLTPYLEPVLMRVCVFQNGQLQGAPRSCTSTPPAAPLISSLSSGSSGSGHDRVPLPLRLE